MIVGYDKNGSKLELGDICKFTVDKVETEGMITYDEGCFAYAFDILSGRYSPSILMYKVDLSSIEKIMNVYSTKDGDMYREYRDLVNKIK